MCLFVQVAIRCTTRKKTWTSINHFAMARSVKITPDQIELKALNIYKLWTVWCIKSFWFLFSWVVLLGHYFVINKRIIRTRYCRWVVEEKSCSKVSLHIEPTVLERRALGGLCYVLWLDLGMLQSDPSSYGHHNTDTSVLYISDSPLRLSRNRICMSVPYFHFSGTLIEWC